MRPSEPVLRGSCDQKARGPSVSTYKPYLPYLPYITPVTHSFGIICNAIIMPTTTEQDQNIATSYASATAGNNDAMTLRKVAGKTSALAKEGLAEIEENVNEGNMSLRILGVIGALSLITVTTLGLAADMMGLKGVSFIYGIYGFCLGFIILTAEYGSKLPWVGKKLEAKLYKNLRCLRMVWGRGCLLFFAGTIQWAQDEIINYMLGVYLCSVGILFILVGRSAGRKLAAIRRSSFRREQIEKMFMAIDTDGTGTITKKQFGELTSQLRMDLTRREVELTFRQIDVTNEGSVSFEMVWQWWISDDIENDSFANERYSPV